MFDYKKDDKPYPIYDEGIDVDIMLPMSDERSEKLHQMIEPLSEILSKMARMLKQNLEAMAPLTQIVEMIAKQFEPYAAYSDKMCKSLNVMSEAMHKYLSFMMAIKKLSDAQYVFWDFLNENLVDIFINSSNIDAALLDYHKMNNFEFLNQVIKNCGEHSLMVVYMPLWTQTVGAYRGGHYDLAVVGLISIIDGLLSDVTGDLKSTSIFSRAKNILDKVIQDETAIENCDFGITALATTFEATMQSLGATSDFSRDEPNNLNLNRHWIMHGRSKRSKTQIDCIKLINFIRGIILISDSAR